MVMIQGRAQPCGAWLPASAVQFGTACACTSAYARLHAAVRIKATLGRASRERPTHLSSKAVKGARNMIS